MLGARRQLYVDSWSRAAQAVDATFLPGLNGLPSNCAKRAYAIDSGSWSNPGELKQTFASASFIGDLTIFNVGGNKYRIAAFVHYAKQIVYIKRIGTDQEYDRWDL